MAWQARIEAWLRDRPDDAVLRWLLRAVVAATVAVVALDVIETSQAVQPSLRERDEAAPQTEASPLWPARREGETRTAPLRPKDDRLAAPMSFDLVAGGRLLAVGTIAPGTAAAFAAELDKRGSYVKTVVLHSPGGSVADALAMGRRIRKSGLATEVGPAQYCASSCPLVFAGGVERRALDDAAIGVHQVSALAGDGQPADAGMAGAQRISAACQIYLGEMGVDLAVWVHAMETPRERLYYFKPHELVSLKLATAAGAAAAAPRAAGKS